MSELNDIRYQLPEVERAMVLAPHPDDETLGCGGIMASHSGRISFTVVALSDGEAVNIPEENKADLRKREFEDAMGVLGVKDTVSLGIPDGKFLQHKDEMREKLSELLELRKPQIVFSPSPVDLHQDHRETALACIELLEKLPFIRIAFYEIYNPVRFNTLIDIGKDIGKKKEALARYHHSLLAKEDIFIASITSLNRFRSLFALRDSYYEAFWITDAVTGISGIMNRLTYSVSPPPPEGRLLSAIRVSDSLVHEYKKVERALADKVESIHKLSLELRDKEETIVSLRENLRIIETSLSWRLAQGFRKMKTRLLP